MAFKLICGFTQRSYSFATSLVTNFLGSPNPTISSLPNEAMAEITSYLKVSELCNLRLVNWHGETHGSYAFVRRSKEFGFQALDFAGATQHLGNLFKEVKEACDSYRFFGGLVPAKYSDLAKKILDSEETLRSLENISTENLFHILADDMVMNSPSFRQLLSFKLHLRSKEQDLELADSIKKYGITLLVNAAKRGAQNIVEFMLNHGVDINARQKGPDQTTALIEASKGHSSIECFEFLITNGADVNLADSRDITPLQIAAVCKAVKCVKCLIEKGANVNAADIGGYTPLMQARSVEIANLLIQAGANVNALAQGGSSILRGHTGTADALNICRLLIKNGTNVHHIDDSGNTYLHYVAQSGRKDLVELMLEHGVDINIRNDDEKRAIDLATDSGHQTIVELLTSHDTNT